MQRDAAARSWHSVAVSDRRCRDGDDLRHFLDMLDDEPAPAKRLAVRLSAIVR